MKNVKRILSCFLSVLVTFMLFGITFSKSAKADSLPVQLYYAKYAGTSTGNDSVIGYIAVQKLSSDKNVIIHYSTDNGASWKDLNAKYVKDNPSDGCEIWSFNLNVTTSNPVVKFAIRCDSDGVSYWDNNHGNNYCVSPTLQGAFGKSQLFETRTQSYKDNNGFGVDGSVILNNIGSPKAVTIRYSYDNWATYSEVSAQYLSNSDDNTEEEWIFGIPANLSAKQISFSVRYTVNGVDYWDNNFGDNYNLTAN